MIFSFLLKSFYLYLYLWAGLWLWLFGLLRFLPRLTGHPLAMVYSQIHVCTNTQYTNTQYTNKHVCTNTQYEKILVYTNTRYTNIHVLQLNKQISSCFNSFRIKKSDKICNMKNILKSEIFEIGNSLGQETGLWKLVVNQQNLRLAFGATIIH